MTTSVRLLARPAGPVPLVSAVCSWTGALIAFSSGRSSAGCRHRPCKGFPAASRFDPAQPAARGARSTRRAQGLSHDLTGRGSQDVALRAHAPDRAVLPDVRGLRRVADCRAVGGIVHAIRRRCRWQDAPRGRGPRKTLCNQVRPPAWIPGKTKACSARPCCSRTCPRHARWSRIAATAIDPVGTPRQSAAACPEPLRPKPQTIVSTIGPATAALVASGTPSAAPRTGIESSPPAAAARAPSTRPSASPSSPSGCHGKPWARRRERTPDTQYVFPGICLPLKAQATGG